MTRMRVISIMLLMFALIVLSACGSCPYKTECQSEMQTQMYAAPILNRIHDRGELVVGMSGDQPPFNMTTRDGKIIGLEVDIATLIAKAMNVQLRIEDMKFAQLLPALEAGKVDMVISGVTIIPERNLKVAFVGPYFISGKSFLTKLNTLASVKEPSQINNSHTKLAVLEGSTSQMFVETFIPDATIVKTQDYDEAKNLVFDDKVDALIADYPFCLTTVFQYPDQELVSLIKPITYEPLGIAIPGNDPLLTNWLENYLSFIEGSGLLDKIEDKWLEDPSWLEQMP